MYVNKEGEWFHRGTPLVHRGLIQLFYQCLDTDAQGCYIIKLRHQTCRLDVEDTPFVVVRTDHIPPEKNRGRETFVLHIIDGTKEELDPASLHVGPNNVLYCQIKTGRFKARLNRSAYYQLASHIREDRETGRYVLPVNDTPHPVSGTDK